MDNLSCCSKTKSIQIIKADDDTYYLGIVCPAHGQQAKLSQNYLNKLQAQYYLDVNSN